MKTLYDLVEDLFKYLAGAVSDLFGMMADLSKNPFWETVSEDLKKGFSSAASSLLDLSQKTYYAVREKIRSNDIVSQVLLWASVALVSISLIVIGVVFQVGNRWDRNLYTVNIPQGYGASDVADLLIERGIIGSRYGFDIMTGVLGLERGVQAGVYKFSPSMGLGQVVMKLKKGDIVAPPLTKIIFPEGTSIYKMGTTLKDAGLGDGDKFPLLAEEPVGDDLREKFPFLRMVKTDSLEGFLFPDTYFVPDGVSNAGLRDLMLSRFSSVAMPILSEASKSSSMSPYEILVLASIIEKEAAVEEERPIISSVFYNRLKKRMYLSADPTVKYALSRFRRPTKKVYYIDLEIDSPYNTYKHLGLPPGPICNPGLASIRAAIYPAKTEYLYFVARGDGTHIFSRTWQEHERAKVLAKEK